MKNYDQMVQDAQKEVREIQPWDLQASLSSGNAPLLLDVREPAEFARLRIPGSLNVPRGVLEQSCEWNYDETVPLLASSRDLDLVVICRSGKRSLLAARTLLDMGFSSVASLRTGVRGWNDFEAPLEDGEGNFVDPDSADLLLAPHLSPEQRR